MGFTNIIDFSAPLALLASVEMTSKRYKFLFRAYHISRYD